MSGLFTGRCVQYVQHVAGPLLSYLEEIPRLSLPAEGIVLAHVWLLLCCNMADWAHASLQHACLRLLMGKRDAAQAASRHQHNCLPLDASRPLAWQLCVCPSLVEAQPYNGRDALCPKVICSSCRPPTNTTMPARASHTCQLAVHVLPSWLCCCTSS